VRAVLGQQVTVDVATTLARRFAERFGEPLETGDAGLHRLSPTAARVAGSSTEEIAAVGIVSVRAGSILALARAVSAGQLRLEPGADPRATIEQLRMVPGIGAWTAEYIAMRALRWPDAFPRDDVALRKALGGVGADEAEALAEAWRPWRSYAAVHLWGGRGKGVT
jgi:3-methyladenine DNA glycosylase/8-oxoguanine DNA glycosylase